MASQREGEAITPDPIQARRSFSRCDFVIHCTPDSIRPHRASSMNPPFRPATNADRPAIEALVFSVLREYGLEPDPAGTDADLRDIEGAYQAAGGMFDVLMDAQGGVIGTVAVFRVDSMTCELRKMYLVPAVRGRGLGRMMLEHALRRAAKLGFRRIVLETASVLREAVVLYESRGFLRHSPGHMSARCDAAYYLDLDAQATAPRG
jgi:putative acetyltransferase